MDGNRGFFAIMLVLLSAAVFSLPLSASAATSPGVKPGSFFYLFDTTFEKIELFFTFNSEKKVKKALEYAEERLAEAEAVANENKPEAVATAMANYQENVSLATAESKEIKDKEKAENLLSTIADNTSKHQEVLAEVYNKVPDEAKKAIEKAIEISIKGREEALKEIQGLKKTVEELQKDIELLKQQGQSDQSKEIEVLRKEVETLKSQQSSQSAKPQVIEKVVEKIVEVPPTTPQKFTTKLSNSEIIEKVKPAVVYIQTSDGSGSGMIMESNGYVLTNAHVVSDVSVAKIKLSDGRLFIGSVVGRDENIDLALLKIQGDNLPTVVLGDSSTDALKQGDEVFTLGYPFGLEEDVSFKEGTISRRLSDGDTTYLETSAEIHPGNSGGPLVNRYGQVIGINTAIFGKSVSGIQLGETIKLAIPINNTKNLIADLKAGRNNVVQKIYEIISLDNILGDTSSYSLEDYRALSEIYMEFLLTSDLRYMTPEKQLALLKPKLEAYINERKAQERRRVEAEETEKRRRIEEENKRIEAQILVAQQCRQNKQAIVTEYNDRKFNLEQQITDRRAKYYTDYAALTESFKGRGVTASGVQYKYDALLRETNADIDQLELEIDNLYIDYSRRFNQFQC